MPLLALFLPMIKSLLELVIGKTADGFGERSAAKAANAACEAKIRSVVESAEAERRIMQAMKVAPITTPDAWNKLVK